MTSFPRLAFLTLLASPLLACGQSVAATPTADAAPSSDASPSANASPSPPGTACRAAGGTCIGSWGGDQCPANDGNWATGAAEDCSDGTEAAYRCCLPGPVTPIPCGPSLTCDGPYHFCQITHHVDAATDAGLPDTFACFVADGCAPGTTCACVLPDFPAQQCAESMNDVTETRAVRDFPCGPSLACKAPFEECLVTVLPTMDGGTDSSYTCYFGMPGCTDGIITCACATAGQLGETCSESGGTVTVIVTSH